MSLNKEKDSLSNLNSSQNDKKIKEVELTLTDEEENSDETEDDEEEKEINKKSGNKLK